MSSERNESTQENPTQSQARQSSLPPPLPLKKTTQHDQLLEKSDGGKSEAAETTSRSKTCGRDGVGSALEGLASPQEGGGRERLKRHRREVASRVWIPEIWEQEELLKDWIDCSGFEAALVPAGIVSARAALAEEGRRAKYSGGFRIENRCS